MARRPQRFSLLGPKHLMLARIWKAIKRANNKKKIARHKDGVGRADEIPIPSHPKIIPFVPPKLDSNRLIIEELEMGFLPKTKAKIGDEVTVRCFYKTSKNDKSPHIVNRTFVLGKSKVMKGLHEGICGMCLHDKRRLYIPPSLCHDGNSICEVKLVKLGS